MQKRRVATHTVRWALLIACAVVVFGLARLFWSDASDGRASREGERTQSAQERTNDTVPDVPAAPAQQ